MCFANTNDMFLQEHLKEGNCEMMMIEQALAIATNSGLPGQATIQLPSSFAVEGMDGQAVNITVEHVTGNEICP